jgi:SAM-dependent methyltransferase
MSHHKHQWWSKEFGNEYLLAMSPELSSEETNIETDFIIKATKISPKDSILDLACADGRHTLELTKRGYQATGLDYSAKYIQLAQKKAAKFRLPANFVVGDMRNLLYYEKFDVILILRTSFGYFSDQDNQKTISSAYQALKPGGRLLIDMYNKSFLIKEIIKKGTKHNHPLNYIWKRSFVKNQITYRDTDYYTPGNNLIHSVKELISNEKKSKYEYLIRYYSLTDYKKMFTKANLKFVKAWGNYHLQHHWHSQSWRTIVLGKKPGNKLFSKIFNFFHGQK